MKGNKIVILLLAFVLPISIFIFLKGFGKNEFAVEPFYQNGTINNNQYCELQYSVPYTVSESIMEAIHFDRETDLALYVFVDDSFDEKSISKRLSEKFDQSDVRIYTLLNDKVASEIISTTYQVVSLSDSSISRLQACEFIMEVNKNSVLIDQQRRIRGYYNLAARAEVDRLNVEIEIILKKY